MISLKDTKHTTTTEDLRKHLGESVEQLSSTRVAWVTIDCFEVAPILNAEDKWLVECSDDLCDRTMITSWDNLVTTLDRLRLDH